MRIEFFRRDSLARRRLMVSCGLVVLLVPGTSLWPIASLFAQKRARPDTTIWSGQSGGFILNWTTADITAFPVDQPSKVVFSAREIALKRFDAFKKENPQSDSSWRCSYSLRFAVLSFVGSLLSYEENEDSYCGSVNGGGWNHPSDQIRYHTIDLNQPNLPITLTKYISETSLLEALLADLTVKKALRDAGNTVKPKSITSLVKAINEGAEIKPTKSSAEAPKECGFVFPDHPFAEFAFHHIENDRIAVSFSLEPNSGACHSAHSQLGILLAIPESLKESLIAAQSRTQGLLMERERRVALGKATLFEFETSEPKRNGKR